MKLTATILGCGPSGGVPRVGLGWGACDALEPKNRRQRCSVLFEQTALDGGKTRVLIDTSPDLRAQLLAHDVVALDAICYTHMHADHTHGIDDVRPLFQISNRAIPAYMDEATSQDLMGKFLYCFDSPEDSDYPPILSERRLVDREKIQVHGAGGCIELLPFMQFHGPVTSYGFRVGDFAYSTDLVGLPETSLPCLEGLNTWVVDALRYKKHPSHFSLEETLQWIERVAPQQAYLTNMNTDLDYQTLQNELPKGVLPAYDGLSLAIGAHR